MANTILPVAPSASTVSVNSTSSPGTMSNADFTKVLLAQMSSPNIDSLFSNSQTTQTGSIMGGTASNSLFSNMNPLLAAQFLPSGSVNSASSAMLNPFASGFTATMELSIWSNLIGKDVEATDPTTKEKITGKVSSVLIDSGVAMLEINGSLVHPSSITKVM